MLIYYGKEVTIMEGTGGLDLIGRDTDSLYIKVIEVHNQRF